MPIYVVHLAVFGSNSYDAQIAGVFSTKEKAQEYIDIAINQFVSEEDVLVPGCSFWMDKADKVIATLYITVHRMEFLSCLRNRRRPSYDEMDR